MKWRKAGHYVRKRGEKLSKTVLGIESRDKKPGRVLNDIMNVAGVNWLSTFKEFGRYLEKTRDESKGQKRWLL